MVFSPKSFPPSLSDKQGEQNQYQWNLWNGITRRKHSPGSAGRWYNTGTGWFLPFPHKHPSPLSSPPNSGHTHSPTAGPTEEKIYTAPFPNHVELPATWQQAPGTPIQHLLPSLLLCRQRAPVIPFVMPNSMLYLKALYTLTVSMYKKNQTNTKHVDRSSMCMSV